MSIIGNTEGYVALFRAVLRTGDPVLEPSPNPPVGALVALYKSVLLFNVRATIQVVNQHAGQQIHLQEEIDGISACLNKLIVSLDLLGIQPQISGLLKAVHTKDAALKMNPQQQLSELGLADANPAPQTTLENSDILKRFLALVSRTQVCEDFLQRNFDEGGAQKERRILWIRSRPGAGKTMLLRAIVQSYQRTNNKSMFGFCGHHVAFSFRESGRRRRYWDDYALYAVKDLIYNLILSQLDLCDHLEKLCTIRYAGHKDNRRNDFDAPGDFTAMSMLLCRMVQSEQFQPTYFVLDGIDDGIEPENQEAYSQDEESDFVRLLGLVATTVELSSKVKWILSADHARWDACKREMLEMYDSKLQYQLLDLDTELDAKRATNIVNIVCDYAADRLVNISSSCELGGYYNNSFVCQSLMDMLKQAAPNNFLWTKLALLSIVQASTLPWNAATMLGQLDMRNKTVNDVTYCKNVLETATAAYQPLTVRELVALSGLPPTVELPVLVKTLLPSFLEISDDGIVHFTHLSARDYVRQNLHRLSRVGELSIHTKIAHWCLTILLRKLRRSPDVLGNRNQSNSSHYNIGRIDYIVLMWIRHLSEPCSKDNQSVVKLAVQLLTAHLEEWLSLLGSSSSTFLRCLSMMRQLHATITSRDDMRLPPQHAHQKVPARSSTPAQIIREVIIVLQRCQLRLRSSEEASKEVTLDELDNSLLFAADLPNLRSRLMPAGSFGLVRRNCAPISSTETIRPQNTFDAKVTKLNVFCVAFSPDGKFLAAGGNDRRLRIWRRDGDGGTKSPEYTGERADATITGAVYSDDGNKVITVSQGGSIAVWTLENDRSAPLRPKIVRRFASSNGYDVSFRRIRFDTENYPGIAFTEHGPMCVDLDKNAIEHDSDVDEKGEKEDKETADRGGWYLPQSGVHNGSVMWNNHVVALPESLKLAEEESEEKFTWLVQGRVMVVGCMRGQVLLFRFAEDAYPRRR
ncbi:hypothetical protein MY5147_004219 [Beauveria neobassiana]